MQPPPSRLLICGFGVQVPDGAQLISHARRPPTNRFEALAFHSAWSPHGGPPSRMPFVHQRQLAVVYKINPDSVQIRE